ncbi:hypothetical protein [uncultured Megamonas sp.]|uniref:hypothetical protein n=1 Tax=uncultured Megamonas sp. TaxID=286140 RepID=UPI00259AFBAE|nr:hypothetical protein [uncultured Megamonas sp.]
MTNNMIDYLFKDIVKDIEYAYSHRIKVNKLPNEDKLKVKLIKSIHEVYKKEPLDDNTNDFYEYVEKYKL